MGEQPATLVERIGKVSLYSGTKARILEGNYCRLRERYLASFYGTTISGSDTVTKSHKRYSHLIAQGRDPE